jgi:hypothetical protein
MGVPVNPTDALQFQDDVFLVEFGQALCYRKGEFRLGFCSPESGATASGRQYSGALGCRAAELGSSLTRDREAKTINESEPQSGLASRSTSSPRARLALPV